MAEGGWRPGLDLGARPWSGTGPISLAMSHEPCAMSHQERSKQQAASIVALWLNSYSGYKSRESKIANSLIGNTWAFFNFSLRFLVSYQCPGPISIDIHGGLQKYVSVQKCLFVSMDTDEHP